MHVPRRVTRGFAASLDDLVPAQQEHPRQPQIAAERQYQ
jgi:hypothetical protein